MYSSALYGAPLYLETTHAEKKKGRGGLVVRSRLRAGGVQARNPIPLTILYVWDLLHVKSYVMAKSPSPLVWCGSLEEGVTAQVSSSSSDCGSKLRGLSQNSRRVASKRDVNI
ncbi:hypothetical protein AVEN_96583-1 [Araneus ventricosus]|uniref:Uncharacterized protein n=1 Tax=Araneus ventricosus TaxID=182803 RepID=A0A4Y2UWF8_ARAVE|nr:hypothetical protein AVEN_96583-1 [Araneus ventricosus]